VFPESLRLIQIGDWTFTCQYKEMLDNFSLLRENKAATEVH
jgi:hypothetical protein